jgi:hypothetical protein
MLLKSNISDGLTIDAQQSTENSHLCEDMIKIVNEGQNSSEEIDLVIKSLICSEKMMEGHLLVQ